MRSKRAFVTACILFLFLFIIACKQETGTVSGKQQTICPIMGGKINKQYFADYRGYRIYFCCAGCSDEFKKDPEKHMKRFRDEGIVLEKSPSGEKPDEKAGHDLEKDQHKGHTH